MFAKGAWLDALAEFVLTSCFGLFSIEDVVAWLDALPDVVGTVSFSLDRFRLNSFDMMAILKSFSISSILYSREHTLNKLANSLTYRNRFWMFWCGMTH